MTSEQLQNAQIIVSVGTSLGANSKQLLAALEAGLVESGLRNLNYGDRDSLGVFQQRPSQGWGSAAQVRDVYNAARSFFLGAGTNPGVFEVSQSGTAGQMAQRVQRSAFPGRYDEYESQAASLLSQFGVVAQDPASIDDSAALGIYTDDYSSEPLFFQSSSAGIGIGAVIAVVGGVLLLLMLRD